MADEERKSEFVGESNALAQSMVQCAMSVGCAPSVIAFAALQAACAMSVALEIPMEVWLQGAQRLFAVTKKTSDEIKAAEQQQAQPSALTREQKGIVERLVQEALRTPLDEGKGA